MMEDKDMVLLLAVVMIFFATLFISKQQAVASASVPTISTSVNVAAKSQIVDEAAAKAKAKAKAEAEAEAEHQKLLVAKQIKIDEDLRNQLQLAELEKKIKAFIGDDIDKFGMVYYDINSEESIEINVDNQFLAASTVKVPINMLVYDMIQDKKIDINEELKYRKTDFEGGAGILQGTDLTKPIPIKELSDYSIRYSDNIAINMLLRRVGNKNRYAYIEKITGHPLVLKGNYTTPMDSFKILERLYLNPDKNEYYSGLIENMKKTEYHDRIDKYIPQEIVAHKIGNYAEYVNDMAIVYDEEPYMLAVFTKNMPEAAENIAQVSKMIYEAQQ